MKKTLLSAFLCLVVLLTGCGRVKRKLSGGSQPKAPPKDPFYTYDGFRDWYRFPLKYPYQVMMIDDYDDGYLQLFEGGNIEENPAMTVAGRITDLHLHEDYAFFKKEECTYGYLQYSTGEVRLFETEEELKQACLLDPEDFKPLKYYYKLFEKGTVMYPPPDPSKKKDVRFNAVSHFHGLAVKMFPDAAYSNGDRGPARIEVICAEGGGEIEIETGKLAWGSLPQDALDSIAEWLPMHRDELLEMWKTRKLKELPPLPARK